MPVFEADGHCIGYHEAGPPDAPLVLFAHCSLGHGGLWKGVMSELADKWRCVATDLPGHGRSDRGDESISLQDQAGADIATLADAFADGRAHLVGLSIGGAVMARAAVRRPGLAKSLALLEPILMHLLSDDHAARAEENADTTTRPPDRTARAIPASTGSSSSTGPVVAAGWAAGPPVRPNPP